MNILIADDHTFIRSGLCEGLKKAFPNATITEAGSATETLETVQKDPLFDIAIVDLFMPDMNGFSFLKKLCLTAPQIPVIVISATTSTTHIEKVMGLGTSGFISKSAGEEEFISAINTVLSGGVHVPTALKSVVSRPMNTSTSGPLLNNLGRQLTERQLEILIKLGEGKTNKQIAEELKLSENTIKVHVSRVLKIFEIENRTQAGVIADKLQLL